MSIDLDATAVGGSKQGVCNMAPLFVCNPLEGSGTDIYSVAGSRSFQRRQLLIMTKGSGSDAKYFPGNFLGSVAWRNYPENYYYLDNSCV